jgi:DNA-binding CsgD family transcriptional regulator
LASDGEKEGRRQRRYRPSVERLEAVRLLSSATQAHPLASVAAEHDLRAEAGGTVSHLGDGSQAAVSSATWDAALVQTELADILGSGGGATAAAIAPTTSSEPKVTAPPVSTADTKALTSGLTQLNKYLSRAWYRAGISQQLHDDSSQAVYATLLQSLGRSQFDSLIADVGHWGIKDVFTRETSEGLAFFRAVDMVKKRAQRERIYQSLDSIDVAGPADDYGEGAARRQALKEAIEHTLSPREAALIQDTLMGKSPAEIAAGWGVAPKTVSNEKTRVLQKLRLALADHEMN